LAKSDIFATLKNHQKNEHNNMISLAIKMLTGNRATCLGLIFGIFLATLLIAQQSAIFLGLVSRSYRMVTDISIPDIWVVDPATASDDRVRPIPEGLLDVVRSVPGVKWAVPIDRANLPLVTQSGVFQVCDLFGVDDVTLIGAPRNMIAGSITDLRREGGVIVDVYSARGLLAKTQPNGTKVPLKIGDELEINSRRAVVVGLCKITQGFYPQPIIFTSYSQFKLFNPTSKNFFSFIAAKSVPDVNINKLLQDIKGHSGLNAMTREQFIWTIIDSFLATGILINFGLTVALGFIIGISITGQIFYVMTLENLSYYALIKAIGGTHMMILKMITAQALLVGIVGFLLGIGTTLLWGWAIEDTSLAFLFPWQVLLFTGLVILVICVMTAALSIRKVLTSDPKTLIGN
jgi:putative ABC transport system permease protein